MKSGQRDRAGLEERVHPTVNLTRPDPECDLDYVPQKARSQPIETALKNSFGMGGHNACLVIGKWS